MMQLINQLTKDWLRAYTNNPTASVMIDANGDMPTGILIAKQLHNDIVTDPTSPLIVLQPTKTKSIGIDSVRELQHTLSLKANKSSKISRMAAIYQADKLTPEAQNALLRLIEELPESTIICLVADTADLLLETIRSRCFSIPLLPYNTDSAREHFSVSNTDKALVERAISMSDGNLSAFISFLEGDKNEIMDTAKQFLQSTVYDRQIMLNKLRKSKSFEVDKFIQALSLISKISMRRAPSDSAKQQWKVRLKILLESQDMLNRNVMSKLVMLRLSVLI